MKHLREKRREQGVCKINRKSLGCLLETFALHLPEASCGFCKAGVLPKELCSLAEGEKPTRMFTCKGRIGQINYASSILPFNSIPGSEGVGGERVQEVHALQVPARARYWKPGPGSCTCFHATGRIQVFGLHPTQGKEETPWFRTCCRAEMVQLSRCC